MRALGAAFAADPTLFDEYEPRLLSAAEDFTPEMALAQSRGRDSVVLTMSYVLHQKFMDDGRAFTGIIRSLSGSRLPIWVIAQDANLPKIDEANLESWPETRLGTMLNNVEAYGYRFQLWSKKFEAGQILLDEHWSATETPPKGHMKTKAIAARLDPA